MCWPMGIGAALPCLKSFPLITEAPPGLHGLPVAPSNILRISHGQIAGDHMDEQQGSQLATNMENGKLTNMNVFVWEILKMMCLKIH